MLRRAVRDICKVCLYGHCRIFFTYNSPWRNCFTLTFTCTGIIYRVMCGILLCGILLPGACIVCTGGLYTQVYVINAWLFLSALLLFLSCVKSRVSSSNCTSTLGCLIDCISLFLICVTRCLADGILLDGRTTPPVEKAVQLKFVQDYVQDFVTMKFAIFVFLSKRL